MCIPTITNKQTNITVKQNPLSSSCTQGIEVNICYTVHYEEMLLVRFEIFYQKTVS